MSFSDDNLTPLNRGMVAAIRKKQYFDTLDDILKTMNPVVWSLYPTEAKTSTAFFDRIFDSRALGQNFLKIRSMYERGLLPIRATMPADDDSKLQEQAEQEQLISAIAVAYPPPDGPSEDLERFARFFRSRPAAACDTDFTECREMLEITCLRLAGMRNAGDQKLFEANPKQALENIEKRVKTIKDVFARGASQFLSSVSDQLQKTLFDPELAARTPFLAGDASDSLDGVLGGFHGAGLVTLLGGTSGGKTLAMSSLAANHCLNAFMREQPAPVIWGYIGEDSVESYTQRMLVNLLNRDVIRQNLDISEFNIGDWPELCRDPLFKAAASGLIEQMMSGCSWLRAPERIEEKINFSTESMLESFDAKLDGGAEPPKFIIVDYFNLLKLSRRNMTANRPFDLQQLSHYLDEWSTGRGITIVTAVQASIHGIIGARDMRFFEQEDLHECKSIAHNSRMVVSLLPFKQYNVDDGSSQDWMGLKILKNRGGPRDIVFVSDLDFGKNQTLIETRMMTDVEWAQYRMELLEARRQLLSESGEDDQPAGGGFRRPRERGPV